MLLVLYVLLVVCILYRLALFINYLAVIAVEELEIQEISLVPRVCASARDH